MKKLILTLTIVLGFGMGAFAQGGLFERGTVSDEDYYGYGGKSIATPMFPGHNQTTNQPAPLGSGALLLIGFGAAYLIGKQKKD